MHGVTVTLEGIHETGSVQKVHEAAAICTSLPVVLDGVGDVPGDD